jgi:hypothetical protein
MISTAPRTAPNRQAGPDRLGPNPEIENSSIYEGWDTSAASFLDLDLVESQVSVRAKSSNTEAAEY